MPKNNLYTLSYFRKRLREENIFSDILNIKYSNNDKRYWTININPQTGDNILVTCIKTEDDYWFKLCTKENQNMTVKTKSMESFIQIIKDIIVGNTEVNSPIPILKF